MDKGCLNRVLKAPVGSGWADPAKADNKPGQIPQKQTARFCEICLAAARASL